MLKVNSYRGVSISQPEILKEVIRQLNKDIAMCGFEGEFSENSTLENLLENFTKWVVEKLEHDDSQLLNFLYRVDVKQEKIYANDGNPQDNFVFRVLERELQKIVLRREFSAPNNNLELE